ncbi:hypothetical protein GGR31_000879 [Mesonia maritima]|uniref:Uncharacterized protein n=1 Tax=Mesonia maritima TaxID=1793873 RepID=A0ABU1K3Q1_9FLAO|nr:hypothetical protein [Mesonia maritima]
MDDFDEDANNMYNLYLPFSLANLNGKAVALKINKLKKEYVYYLKDFPYLKSINGI